MLKYSFSFPLALWTKIAGVLTGSVLFTLLCLTQAVAETIWDNNSFVLDQKFCQEFSRQVEDPKAFYTVDDQKRVLFIQGHCHILSGAFEDGEKAFAEGQKLDAENKDIWLYQRLKNYLESPAPEKAFPLVRQLISLPAYPDYESRLQQNIRKNFRNSESLVFPLLHDIIQKTSKIFQDPVIIGIYLRGARQLEYTVSPRMLLLQWQYPEDRDTALQSDQAMSQMILDQQIVLNATNYFNRFNHLENINQHKLLLQSIPEKLSEFEPQDREKLGKIYIRALYSDRQYTELLKQFNENNFAQQFQLPLATQEYWVVKIYLNRKQVLEAEQYVLSIREHSPKYYLLPSLYERLATYFLIVKNDVKAMEWYQKLLTDYPGNSLNEVALWELSWNEIQKKQHAQAVSWIKNALKSKLSSPEVHAKFLYWQAKSELAVGNKKQAKSLFTQLSRDFPNTYYGIRLQKTKALAQLVQAPSFETHQLGDLKYDNPIPLTLERQPLFSRIEFFLDVRELDQGWSELSRLLKTHPKNDVIWHGAEILKQAGNFYALQKVVANYYMWDLKGLAIRDQPLWQFAYPRPYWTTVKHFSNKAGIDPYWALAIMREESHFLETALSSTQARGLMQLMPDTARHIAKKEKFRLKDEEDLFNPEINIRLGTTYLGWLKNQFGNNIVHTAAGYNGGPNSVKRWLKSWNKTPEDEFVEQIPYGETQNYVKRVFTTYHLYQKIYQNN
ncbi:MAG: transglycosylase SLT domain-containing protein [SAR324 cluster bacterium]|nr:transglycosylase SLT domain-containing protein [SAR324 cluster bacterium]